MNISELTFNYETVKKCFSSNRTEKLSNKEMMNYYNSILGLGRINTKESIINLLEEKELKKIKSEFERKNNELIALSTIKDENLESCAKIDVSMEEFAKNCPDFRNSFAETSKTIKTKIEDKNKLNSEVKKIKTQIDKEKEKIRKINFNSAHFAQNILHLKRAAEMVLKKVKIGKKSASAFNLLSAEQKSKLKSLPFPLFFLCHSVLVFGQKKYSLGIECVSEVLGEKNDRFWEDCVVITIENIKCCLIFICAVKNNEIFVGEKYNKHILLFELFPGESECAAEPTKMSNLEFFSPKWGQMVCGVMGLKLDLHSVLERIEQRWDAINDFKTQFLGLLKGENLSSKLKKREICENGLGLEERQKINRFCDLFAIEMEYNGTQLLIETCIFPDYPFKHPVYKLNITDCSQNDNNYGLRKFEPPLANLLHKNDVSDPNLERMYKNVTFCQEVTEKIYKIKPEKAENSMFSEQIKLIDACLVEFVNEKAKTEISAINEEVGFFEDVNDKKGETERKIKFY